MHVACPRIAPDAAADVLVRFVRNVGSGSCMTGLACWLLSVVTPTIFSTAGSDARGAVGQLANRRFGVIDDVGRRQRSGPVLYLRMCRLAMLDGGAIHPSPPKNSILESRWDADSMTDLCKISGSQPNSLLVSMAHHDRRHLL